MKVESYVMAALEQQHGRRGFVRGRRMGACPHILYGGDGVTVCLRESII